jgi:hypothetical protein
MMEKIPLLTNPIVLRSPHEVGILPIELGVVIAVQNYKNKLFFLYIFRKFVKTFLV